MCTHTHTVRIADPTTDYENCIWTLILITFFDLKLKLSYSYILYQHLRLFHSCRRQWLRRQRSRLNTKTTWMQLWTTCCFLHPIFLFFGLKQPVGSHVHSRDHTPCESVSISDYHVIILELPTTVQVFPCSQTHTRKRRKTQLHTFPRKPTHTQLTMVSVSSLPQLTCHLYFATLCLHSNHSYTPLTKRLCWLTNQKSGPQGWELARVLWLWLGSTSFKYKTKFTCVLTTCSLRSFKSAPCVLFWCCKESIKCL